MRPGTTGTSAVARPQQQPPQTFQPKSEWKHEDEANFLFVYLPGFALEQLTITSDYSNRTVKVQGQRRLPNNKLLPLNETFAIPEESDLSKMDKQFGRGVLMLKLPKNIIIPQQQTTRETKEETPMPQEQVGDSTARKDEEIYPPKEMSKQNPDRAAIVPQVTATGDEKNMMMAAKGDEEKLAGRNEENDGDGKPDKPEGLGVKEDESKAESTESATSGSAMSVAKVEEKEKDKSPKLADAKGKETKKENANGSAKQGIVKELNQDRKLMANMGAAVLIIMGLGVSILYLRS
ncbi:hypothetical protein DITRI_Ditri09bG0075700 [Diplodiscus trichospermus]